MKVFSLIFLCLVSILVGCSHYGPVSLGQGVPSDKEVVSCTPSVLTFPLEREKRRMDTILRQNQLTPDDVASVEERAWPYLSPLFMSTCTVVVLNEQGAKKTGVMSEPILPDFLNTGGTKLEKKKKKNERPWANSPSRGTIFFRKKRIDYIEDCRQFHPLIQKSCEANYKRKFN